MKTEHEINYWPREWETKCTSGNSLKTASSAAALHLSILEEDEGDAPKQETWMNLMIPPCSLEICKRLRLLFTNTNRNIKHQTKLRNYRY
jgi:hypothetical protein